MYPTWVRKDFWPVSIDCRGIGGPERVGREEWLRYVTLRGNATPDHQVLRKVVGLVEDVTSHAAKP